MLNPMLRVCVVQHPPVGVSRSVPLAHCCMSQTIPKTTENIILAKNVWHRDYFIRKEDNFYCTKIIEEKMACAISDLEGCYDRKIPNIGGIVEEYIELNRDTT